MKICGKCKLEKDFSEFHKNAAKPDGLQSNCKACKNEQYQGYYSENKERYAKNSRTHRRRMREKIRSYKDKPCTDCGVQYPYYVMQFDHLDGDDKLGAIGRMSWSYVKLEQEVAKCDVVCANCHAVRTWQRKQEA